MERLIRLIIMLDVLLILPMQSLPVMQLSLSQVPNNSNTNCSQENETPLALSLDGVVLDGCLPAVPGPLQWVLPQPDQRVQMAYALEPSTHAARFSITAFPFGAAVPTEDFPIVDETTKLEDLREILRQTRESQGGRPQPGPAAQLFGGAAESLVSQVNLPGAGSNSTAVRLTEWLAISGQRVWLVRAIQPVAVIGSPASMDGLDLTGRNLNAPSTSLAAWQAFLRGAVPAGQEAGQEWDAPAGDPVDLPDPSWWGGHTCDGQYYKSHNYYGVSSYQLGTSYRNVDACGPLPAYTYIDVTRYFYSDAFPVYEWECVELSLRYLYLAYKIAPYPANGNGIVYNYSGSKLSKRWNGTSGKAPIAGDVLSYCSWCTFGHTSVVISSNVNSSGNGSITVMEENNTTNGRSTLNVSKWWVDGGSMGPVYGWLHSSQTVPTKVPTPTCAPTPTPGPTSAPVAGPYNYYFPSLIYSQSLTVHC